MNAEISKLVTDFERNIVAAVREQVQAEVVAALEPRVAEMERRVANTEATTRLIAKLAKVSKPRRKGPIQLCPAPGCKERAAPVFRMLCKKHKGAPKATVTKWREARRKKVEVAPTRR
jgi:hypothetical protein